MELVFKKSEKLLSEKIRDIIVWGIVIFFVVTLLFPLISLSIKATEDNAGNFIGLQNFIQYLTSPGVVSSFFNTVKIATLTMVITLILGFGYS
ncbi:MAG: putative 2-aminoethylphosphonate ABC transporter permease subunit, partial [Cetobacterium sp.]